VQRELEKAASTNAMLRTTTALTIFNAGNKDNVLPGQADAVVNFRLFPGDTTDKVVEHTQKAMAVPGLKVAKGPGWSEPSKVAATGSPAFQLINRTVRQLHPDVVVAPGLMIAATDSRYFDAVADNVFKFSPVRAKPEDLKRFHGTNERISIDNYFSIAKAGRDLGYRPLFTTEQAMAECLPYYVDLYDQMKAAGTEPAVAVAATHPAG
jgi:carboxypeptidase PM20D1